MNKIVALLLIVLAASPAHPSPLRLREPRFFGLSSWFGGGDEEEATELPVPDLAAHPLWRVHKYKGISIHPVSLPLEGGSSSPASHVLPPPSANFPTPNTQPPASVYGPPAHTYGPPANTYGTPQAGLSQNQVTESGASSSDVSMGLDALGALASFLPGDGSEGEAGGATGKGAGKKALLQSTLKSVLNIKGNIGTAITELASGKSAALSGLMNGGGPAALLGLLAQYPQLASFLARKHGAKDGHDLPKLPDLPDIPFISGIDAIPELPEVPEIKVPPTSRGSSYPTYGPPSPTYGPPAGSGSFSSSLATAAAIRVPETTYGTPANTVPEPRLPPATLGTSFGGGIQSTGAGAFGQPQVPPTSLVPPSTSFSSRQEQPASPQADLFTTVRFNDQETPALNTIGQFMVRNSDTSKETYVDASGFRPSKELRSSDPEFGASSFFPVARDYVPPFVEYRDDSSPEASVKEEVSVPAFEMDEEDVADDVAAPTPVTTPEVQTKARKFPVSAARAAFSDRFRGGKVHVASGEVTIDTAMRVQG